MLPSLAVERLEERDQIFLFLVRQLQRDEGVIQVRVFDTALVIEIHHFFERLEPPIMHIGCGPSNLAQRRGLERTLYA